MARGGVTFTEVEKAAQYLQGSGRNPTVDSVREYLGTGSRTTLAEHLKRWKAINTNVEGRIPQPLLALVTGLWDSLQSQADQRVQEEKTAFNQEISVLKDQLQASIQNKNRSNQELHKLQEMLDAEQRLKSGLATDLQASEKALDKLNMLHQTAIKQVEDAKIENQRLHKLATQIQTNLEHYQQSIQQQQLEQKLEKEKEHAAYAQELFQLKGNFDKIKENYGASEKELKSTQLQLQQLQSEYESINNRHEKLIEKNKTLEIELIQLQERQKAREKDLAEAKESFVKEQQLTQSLSQQVAVLSERSQRIQNDLDQAEDKINKLRDEKMFLVQEKAQLDGAFKQLQGR